MADKEIDRRKNSVMQSIYQASLRQLLQDDQCRVESCECCGGYHRADFTGDCREDDARLNVQGLRIHAASDTCRVLDTASPWHIQPGERDGVRYVS
jgi:hypothetical protein